VKKIIILGLIVLGFYIYWDEFVNIIDDVRSSNTYQKMEGKLTHTIKKIVSLDVDSVSYPDKTVEKNNKKGERVKNHHNESIRGAQLNSTTNNGENQSQSINNSNTKETNPALTKILERLTPKEVNYFWNVVDSYDSDPQNRVGEFCEDAYGTCKWCNSDFYYEKRLESKIAYMKQLASPTLIGAYMNMALSLSEIFAPAMGEEDPMGKFANDIRNDLRDIKNKDFYVCTGDAPEFCSQRCKTEYEYYNNMR